MKLKRYESIYDHASIEAQEKLGLKTIPSAAGWQTFTESAQKLTAQSKENLESLLQSELGEKVNLSESQVKNLVFMLKKLAKNKSK